MQFFFTNTRYPYGLTFLLLLILAVELVFVPLSSNVILFVIPFTAFFILYWLFYFLPRRLATMIRFTPSKKLEWLNAKGDAFPPRTVADAHYNGWFIVIQLIEFEHSGFQWRQTLWVFRNSTIDAEYRQLIWALREALVKK